MSAAALIDHIRAELDVLAEILQKTEEAAPPLAPSRREGDGLEAEYLTVQDLAERYKVSPATIYRWAREGRFPPGQYWGPRTRRWKRTELEGGVNGYST